MGHGIPTYLLMLSKEVAMVDLTINYPASSQNSPGKKTHATTGALMLDDLDNYRDEEGFQWGRGHRG